MSNKAIGNSLERRVAELLSRDGCWVHLLQQNAGGQPADIIAGKCGKFFLIDCKACTGDKFILSRIEYNQQQAMRLFKVRTKGDCLFAIEISGIIYFVDFRALLQLERSYVDSAWLQEHCFDIEGALCK